VKTLKKEKDSLSSENKFLKKAIKIQADRLNQALQREEKLKTELENTKGQMLLLQAALFAKMQESQQVEEDMAIYYTGDGFDKPGPPPPPVH